MPNTDKPHSYSQVLSAITVVCFSFSAVGQNPPAPSPATQQESTARLQEGAAAAQQRSVAIQRLSVESQRAAIATHYPDTRPRLVPGPPRSFAADAVTAPFTAGCDPVSPMALADAVHRAATTYKVAPSLINAVIRQESGGYPCAVSDKGAMGLMQLMPATAVEMGAGQPFDVNQNVTAGTRLLAELMQRYNGDLNRVLGAYNAGTAAVDRAGGPPPFAETVNYIVIRGSTWSK